MSHSITSARPQYINEQFDRTEVEKTEDERNTVRRPEGANRNSIDYERTGLADQIVAIPLEIQKGKYQSPQTRQCIIDDDIKWQEFEYQKKVSFDFYSK